MILNANASKTLHHSIRVTGQSGAGAFAVQKSFDGTLPEKIANVVTTLITRRTIKLGAKAPN